MLIRGLVVASAMAVATSHAVAAQSTGTCTYASCALGIAPRLTALAVVRGDAQTTAGSLSFVWPRAALVEAFEGDPAAQRIARESVRTRRVAAALTDIGIGLLATGALYSVEKRTGHRAGAAIAAAGAITLAVSVPIQFAADGQLSRAVFEFNRRFAR